MLQINDWGFVELNQGGSYEDITIAPGPRFDERLVYEIEDEMANDEAVIASSSNKITVRNKSGHKQGSTNVKKRPVILAKKEKVNWVCQGMCELQTEFKEANTSNNMIVRLKPG